MKITLLILALLTGPGETRALLEKVRASYTATPSVSLRFVQTYTPAGFSDTTPEKGRLTLQAPDRIRFEYDGAEGKVFTFDGQSARQYVAADKQILVKTLGAAERARLPILFFEKPESVLERFEVTSKPADGGLTELTLTPRPGADLKSLSLRVAPDGDVKRLVVVDSGGNRTAFDLSERKAGPLRPATDFALVPPPGTRVVTE